MSTPTKFLQPAAFADIFAEGELRERALRNFDRMETSEYQLPAIIRPDDYSWPADMEGRTVLALALLGQATHREPLHLNAILEEFSNHLNERGYRGIIRPEGYADEQQLSGHGWLLRGLCECYLWRPTPALAEQIETILQNLFLPTRGLFAGYPRSPEEHNHRNARGEIQQIGEVQDTPIHDWYCSTDIGCAFIPLDGLTQAYTLFPSAALAELIEEMIEAYLTVDYVGISAQTHATLSGLRGVLRMAEYTGREDLILAAERIWALYCGCGMSENFANYNWFGRPFSTEGCAIVDSFMVATSLWRLTDKAGYLQQAHEIIFNAMMYAQRPNGGFGCDTCVGAETTLLHPVNADLYEAWWCCTMRGGEGLARLVESGYLFNEAGFTVPFYWNNQVTFLFPEGELKMIQTTEYPLEGNVSLTVVKGLADCSKSLRLYLPSGATEVELLQDGKPLSFHKENSFIVVQTCLPTGSKFSLRFQMKPLWVGLQNPASLQGYSRVMAGPLVLGVRRPDQTPIDMDSGKTLINQNLIALGQGSFQIGTSEHVLEPAGLWLPIVGQQPGIFQLLFK